MPNFMFRPEMGIWKVIVMRAEEVVLECLVLPDIYLGKFWKTRKDPVNKKLVLFFYPREVHILNLSMTFTQNQNGILYRE